MSETEDSSSEYSEGPESEESSSDIMVVESDIQPYQDEPLADDEDMEADDGNNQQADEDRLTPTDFERRYLGEVSVDVWLVYTSSAFYQSISCHRRQNLSSFVA